MKRVICLAVLLGVLFSLSFSAGISEERYQAVRTGLYLTTNLLPMCPSPALRWKNIEARAIFELTDKEGKIHRKDVTESCTWTSSGDAVEKLGNGSFYTNHEGSATISATYVYSDEDKNKYEITARQSVNVMELKTSGKTSMLRCAALSHLAYTELANSMKGKKVAELFTPQKAGGIGCEVKDDGFILKCEGMITKKNRTATANMCDFIIAAAGDCELWDIVYDGAFSALVFRSGGTFIISYRGTELHNWNDVKTDIKLGLGLVERNQFNKALELCNAYIEVYGKRYVLVTGHSLGGGLANYVSAVTGVQAVTFNAPSTMVTASSNFAAGLADDFGKNFKGLNDDLRIDFVNQYDWVGKVGVGDSKYDLFTGNKVTGYNGDTVSGRLDRTTFIDANESIALGFPTNHDIKRMLNYDYMNSIIGLMPIVSETNPASSQVEWDERVDFFGSAGKDNYTDSTTRDRLRHYLFSGAGDDDVALSGVKYQGYVDGEIITIPTSAIVVLGEGNDSFTDLGASNVKYHYYSGHGCDTINDHAGNDVLYLHGVSNPSVAFENGRYCVKSGSTVIVKLNIESNGVDAGYFEVYSNGALLENGHIDREKKNSVNMIYQCPVRIEIYDNDHHIAEIVQDGVVANGRGDYGSYSTFTSDDGYGKQVSITSSDYTTKVVGLAEGTMRFSIQYESNESQTDWESIEVPVYEGAYYYPSMTYQEDCILSCDYDGDGEVDEKIAAANTANISLPDSLTLKYCETLQLTPVIALEDAECVLEWVSSDTSVVQVDENGKVYAVGFGSAAVMCYSDGASRSSAACSIVVPDEELSINDCTVWGVDPSYEYTGEPIMPEVRLSFREMTLTEDVHYTVEYNEEAVVGASSLTVTGIGCFGDEKTIQFTVLQENADTLDQKIEQVRKQCILDCPDAEVDRALWLHDWLTHNANYDYTLREYGADGVLLKHTGTCQSYTLAYEMLLDEFGIESVQISSDEMGHTWNLVKLNGVWYHVDVTWDDPGDGGSENRDYFGLSLDSIRKDHTGEFKVYVGGSWKTWSAAGFSCPEDLLLDQSILDAPVATYTAGRAPAEFELTDANGKAYTLDSFVGTRTVFVIGYVTCSGTDYFLTRLSRYAHLMDDIQVVVCLVYSPSDEDINRFAAKYSDAFLYLRYTDDQDAWSSWYSAGKGNDTGGYPCVFIMDVDGNYVYAADGDEVLQNDSSILSATLMLPAKSMYTVADMDEGAMIVAYNGLRNSVDIPETIGGKRVVAIGDEAFVNNKAVSDITIPEGVYSIGGNAFKRSAVRKLEMPLSISHIGVGILDDTGIEEVLLYKGSYADEYMKQNYPNVNLRYISQSDRFVIYSLKDNKRYEVTGYSGKPTMIEIAKSIDGKPVTAIADWAFSNCASLESITIPEGVTSIGRGAFHSCSALTEVILPESITSLGYAVFQGCTNLSSLPLPEGITMVAAGRSIADTTTTSVYCNKDSKTAKNIGCRFIDPCYPNVYLRYDDDSALCVCGCIGNDENVIIPYGVKTIENSAFEDCETLKAIKLSEGVESIGYRAFYGCENLSEVKLPTSLTSLGFNTFLHCPKLSSLVLPDGITEIGAYAIDTNVTKIYCKADSMTAKSLGCGFIEPSCPSILLRYDSDKNVLVVDDYIGSDKDIVIPDGVGEIKGSAFYNQYSVKSVFIPKSVQSIEKLAMYGSGITRITMPYSLAVALAPDAENRYEGVAKFLMGSSHMNQLDLIVFMTDDTVTGLWSARAIPETDLDKTLVLPEALTIIEAEAFEGGCFTAVDLRKTKCTSIGSRAFANCAFLKVVYLPSSVQTISNDAFVDCPSDITLVLRNDSPLSKSDGSTLSWAEQWMVDGKGYAIIK